MNQTIQSYVSQDDRQRVESLTAKYRTVLKMLVQYTGGHFDATKAHSETDLLEALDIVQQVVTSRLSTNPNEWKNDHKQNYKALFNSIELEAKQAIQINFSSPNQTGTGFVISKVQQLIVEPIIEILYKIGPTNSIQAISPIIDDAKQTVISIDRTYHPDDASVARHILSKYTQQRSGSERKTMSKKQRLQLIAKVVERMQISDEETA